MQLVPVQGDKQQEGRFKPANMRVWEKGQEEVCWKGLDASTGMDARNLLCMGDRVV